MATIRKAIEDRIRGQVQTLRHVAGAADLDAVTKGRAVAPSAHVFEVSRTAQPNSLLMAVHQETTDSYAVVVVVANHRDASGSDSSDACRLLRDQIATALIGWQANPESAALEYVGGHLVDFANQHLYWQEVYRTTGTLRSVA
ncbi:MAG: hypothetical protein HQL07_04500 [Nitrospirae bacterium]|nr:hypothetical protein [Magnetococcales bacterium]